MQHYIKYAAIPAAALCLFLVFFLTGRNEPTEQLSLTTVEQPVDPQTEVVQQPAPASVTVDVKGAVRHPGVYTFTDEQRIIDAIEAAGGYVEGADSTLINHAQKLSDALVIYVPREGEQLPAMAPATSTTSTTPSENSTRVNINTATEQDLQTLPGIGPSKAQAIIRHRDEHGPFASTEQLTDVTGIGDKTFAQLSDLITVN